MIGVVKDLSKPCSIGVHLAHHFDIRDRFGYYTCDNGQMKLATNLELCCSDLDAFMYLCGAPYDPFSADEWLKFPTTVWQRMMMIKRINVESMYIIAARINSGSLFYDGRNEDILIDNPEVFYGILEFNSKHPKVKS